MKPKVSEPTLKSVTKEELYEYFRYVDDDRPEHGWPKEQADVVADAMFTHEGWRIMVGQIILLIPVIGVDSAIASGLVSGFQCGREFENRLMAKAIREGK